MDCGLQVARVAGSRFLVAIVDCGIVRLCSPQVSGCGLWIVKCYKYIYRLDYML